MRKREIFVLFLTLALYIVAAESTNLEIDNSAPGQIKEIRNFSWASGTYTNAFDLDDYFKDFENDEIEYSAQNGTTMSISINKYNMVSFYSSSTELTECLNINASDDQFETQSNTFCLFTGLDVIPPKWFSPKKSQIRVYKGSTISFTSDWEDERALSKYYLLINEGIGWEYYNGTFSGIEAQAESTVTITAEVNETVYWKFCAEDTGHNSNCTEIYEFSIYPDPPVPEDPEEVDDDTETNNTGEDTSEDTESTIETEQKEDSEVKYEDEADYESQKTELDRKSILVTLKQGQSQTEKLTITNTGSKSKNFRLGIQSLEDLVSLNERNVTIDAGESKTILLKITAPLTAEIKDYYGNLVITSFAAIIVPIAVNINRLNTNYNITVQVEDKEVKPGETVKALIKIQNTGDPLPIKSTLSFAIKDYYGKLSNFSIEEITIGSELELTKELLVPKNEILGEKVFFVSIENEKGTAINSDYFTVGLTFKMSAIINYSIAFALIALISTISIILIYRHKLHKKRFKSINLYLELSEMKDLIKEKKYDQAAKLYITIKQKYGEKVSAEELQNKQKLAKAMEQLVGKINFDEIVEEATKPAPKTAPTKPTTTKPATPQAKPTQATTAPKATPVQKSPAKQVETKTATKNTEPKKPTALPKKKIQQTPKPIPVKPTPTTKPTPTPITPQTKPTPKPVAPTKPKPSPTKNETT